LAAIARLPVGNLLAYDFSTMGGDDSDHEEIDLLIRRLTTRARVPPKATPAVSPPLAWPTPAQPPGVQPVASQQVERRPVGRWTNARALMPSVLTAGLARGFAFGPAISLPHLPDLSRVFRIPGPVTMVRMWVGLGVVHSAAMTFWPYPKTYFWGLVLYLLSLALVLVTGVWGARLSWEARLGAAHTIALGTVVWAIALAAAETLPLL
jgi:hypothetical protein